VNRVDHLLVVLAEEAAEVAKEATKCLRFGPHESEGEFYSTNAERVVEEFNDLYAIMIMLQNEGVLQGKIIRARLLKLKKDSFEKALLWSKDCGRLD
jgi:cell division GTPase FtsZ